MKFIGFDIETRGQGDTYGLQPYRVLQGKAEITSAAFVTEDGTVLFGKLFPTVEELARMLRTVAEHTSFTDAVLVGWNTQFDVAWLIALGLEDEVRACTWMDGEVFRRALENDTSDMRYGLKPTVAKYLPEFAGYEKDVAGNFDQVDDTLLQYNILDAALTARLARQFTATLETRQTLLSAIICQAIIPIAKAWVSGIPVDLAATDTWENEARADRDKHLQSVMLYGRIRQDEQSEAEKMMTSPIKLKKYLHAKGYPVAKTDQTELSKHKEVPLIKAISDWKKSNTAITRFIKSVRASVEYNEHPYTHPSCRLWNTYTGRFGYTSTTGKPKYQTGIAMHQWPRKSVARDVICAPDGWLLVECDFATQESRLICDWSGDPVLYDIFTSGKDLHSYMASIIAEDEYENILDRLEQKDEHTKEMRYLAKVVNLSCQYRTGWKKLIDVGRTQYDVIFDERTAQKLHRLYRDTYTHIPIYWDTAITAGKTNGYAETRGGRRVFIDDWSRAKCWESESTAINFPIQGTGADMKCLGIALTDPIAYDAGGHYLLDLHDALFFLMPDTSAGMEAAVKIQYTLSNLPYEEYYNWSPRVKLPVDLKVGKAWGSLKEIK
jgi:DNA polymerase I-like protein with 3'-5' exonuclease and polymerase domains